MGRLMNTTCEMIVCLRKTNPENEQPQINCEGMDIVLLAKLLLRPSLPAKLTHLRDTGIIIVNN